MLLAIPLSLAVGAFAMWLLMRERTNGALHMAAYYKAKHRDAIGTPIYDELAANYDDFQQWEDEASNR
jgi:hypothetical protein